MIAKAPSADSRRGTISILTLGALALFAAAYLGLDVGNYEHRLSVNLSKLNGKATYAQVCALMQEGGAFRYDGTYHLNPQSPAVTEARRAGDCKDLALWLASKMNDSSVMFVEGHFDLSPTHHAWLEWYGSGQLWILDLTAHFGGSAPMPASQSHNPTSYTYYAPERFITKYGVFTDRGSVAAGAPIFGCSQPAVAE